MWMYVSLVLPDGYSLTEAPYTAVSFAPAAITAAITQGMKLHESKTFLMSLPECHKDGKLT